MKYRVQENTKKKKIPMKTRFSAPVHTGFGAHPAFYTMPRVFDGVKAAGAWRGVNDPAPSSAEVKEIVKLYTFFSSGPSWTVPGRTLPFYFTVILNKINNVRMTQHLHTFYCCLIGN
jgi:hypothetical protein